jgi:hypothetical protein
MWHHTKGRSYSRVVGDVSIRALPQDFMREETWHHTNGCMPSGLHMRGLVILVLSMEPCMEATR